MKRLNLYSVATQGTGAYKEISRVWECSVHPATDVVLFILASVARRPGNCLRLCMGVMLWVRTPVFFFT